MASTASKVRNLLLVKATEIPTPEEVIAKSKKHQGIVFSRYSLRGGGEAVGVGFPDGSVLKYLGLPWNGTDQFRIDRGKTIRSVLGTRLKAYNC